MEVESETGNTIILEEKHSDDGMDDEEATEYLKRYPDVQSITGYNNIVGAKDHWVKFG